MNVVEKKKRIEILLEKGQDATFITSFIVTHLQWAAFLFCILHKGTLANQWAVKNFEKKQVFLFHFTLPHFSF